MKQVSERKCDPDAPTRIVPQALQLPEEQGRRNPITQDAHEEPQRTETLFFHRPLRKNEDLSDEHWELFRLCMSEISGTFIRYLAQIISDSPHLLWPQIITRNIPLLLFEIDQFITEHPIKRIKAVAERYRKMYVEIIESLASSDPETQRMGLRLITGKDGLVESHNPANIFDLDSIHPLGEGGMGTVYGARLKWSGEEVAIKIIKRKYEKRGITEALLTLELAQDEKMPDMKLCFRPKKDVPGIPLSAGKLLFVMSRLPGKTFGEVLAETGRIYPEIQRKRLRQLGDASFSIALMHKRGVIHRDLKPSNLMIGHEDEGTVFDFGLARHLNAETYVPTTVETPIIEDLGVQSSYASFRVPKATEAEASCATATADGLVVGTNVYWSPEHPTNSCCEGSDNFALGLMAVESQIGHMVFEDMQLAEIIVHLRRHRGGLHILDYLATISKSYKQLQENRPWLHDVLKHYMGRDPLRRGESKTFSAVLNLIAVMEEEMASVRMERLNGYLRKRRVQLQHLGEPAALVLPHDSQSRNDWIDDVSQTMKDPMRILQKDAINGLHRLSELVDKIILSGAPVPELQTPEMTISKHFKRILKAG